MVYNTTGTENAKRAYDEALKRVRMLGKRILRETVGGNQGFGIRWETA